MLGEFIERTVVLYVVLPVPVSINCLSVYPENADLSGQFFVRSFNTLK